MSDTPAPTPLEARRAEVAQYDANIAMYQAILATLPTEWPARLEQYRGTKNEHDAAAKIDDLDDVTLLSSCCTPTVAGHRSVPKCWNAPRRPPFWRYLKRRHEPAVHRHQRRHRQRCSSRHQTVPGSHDVPVPNAVAWHLLQPDCAWWLEPVRPRHRPSLRPRRFRRQDHSCHQLPSRLR